MKTRVAVAVVMMFIMGACGETEADSDIDSGVVIDKGRRYVTVLEDDGETEKHTVSKSRARSCAVGERWPEC